MNKVFSMSGHGDPPKKPPGDDDGSGEPTDAPKK